MTKVSKEELEKEKDIDACDHVINDQDETNDEDLPETNLVPGLDKPRERRQSKAKKSK